MCFHSVKIFKHFLGYAISSWTLYCARQTIFLGTKYMKSKAHISVCFSLGCSRCFECTGEGKWCFIYMNHGGCRDLCFCQYQPWWLWQHDDGIGEVSESKVIHRDNHGHLRHIQRVWNCQWVENILSCQFCIISFKQSAVIRVSFTTYSSILMHDEPWSIFCKISTLWF